MIICLVKVKKKIEKEKRKIILILPFIFQVDLHLPCHMGYLLSSCQPMSCQFNKTLTIKINK